MMTDRQQSVSPTFFFKVASQKNLANVKNKEKMALGETITRDLIILLLHARVLVQASFFPGMRSIVILIKVSRFL
jgi:hypothetical protein